MNAREKDPSTPSAKVRVKIDGEAFVVRGRATDRYVEELARLVDGKIEQVRKAQPNLPRHRAAILAAIHLADEVQRTKKENEELTELLEEAQ